MRRRETPKGGKLTPSASNTSRSFKCSRCGITYPTPEASEPQDAGSSGCMVCPNCGFDNCTDQSTVVDVSNEEY